jgi:hypothetical protein
MVPPSAGPADQQRPPARHQRLAAHARKLAGLFGPGGRREDTAALIGPIRARQEPRSVAAVVKSNRSQQANRLLSCLGEFLASRNVIELPASRYEKISDEQAAAPATCRRQALRSSRAGPLWTHHHSSCFECLPAHLHEIQTGAGKWRPSHQGGGQHNARGPRSRQAERVKKFDHHQHHQSADKWWRQSHRTPTGKHAIGSLLADLLSGRHRNRLAALAHLLRAPIVLAALFSFALAISLFVLYTLSFHHCQTSLVDRRPAALSAAGSPEPDDALSGRMRPLPDANRQLVAAARLLSPTIDSETSTGGGGPSSVRVKTDCGYYEGQPEGGALKFKGIAYASPPVGSRRWQKPRPIWLDEQLCSAGSRWPGQAAGEHCVQMSPFNHRVSGSEDCLYLDVFTPARLADNESDTETVQVSVLM